MADRRFLGNAIVRYLLQINFPGKTLGEIEQAVGARPGTAVHQRITEKRQQGFPIVCNKDGEEWRYYILEGQKALCRGLLAKQGRKVAA